MSYKKMALIIKYLNFEVFYLKDKMCKVLNTHVRCN